MRHCRKERPCEKFQRLTEASRLPVSSSQGWCGLHIITYMIMSACGRAWQSSLEQLTRSYVEPAASHSLSIVVQSKIAKLSAGVYSVFQGRHDT